MRCLPKLPLAILYLNAIFCLIASGFLVMSIPAIQQRKDLKIERTSKIEEAMSVDEVKYLAKAYISVMHNNSATSVTLLWIGIGTLLGSAVFSGVAAIQIRNRKVATEEGV